MKNEPELEIKLAYTTGLREIVLNELDPHPIFTLLREGEDCLYLAAGEGTFPLVKQLRSVSRAYAVFQSEKYHPAYLANHKSIIGELIEVVRGGGEENFSTFKITCAGADSPEVRDMAKYVAHTFKLTEAEEADLKIHIIKLGDIWELGAQITARPLSSRAYRARHMSGAMDPTVAYAMNSLCGLEDARSYLNIFSGSGTLLIEAGLSYPKLERLVGFDQDKKHLTLAIQNIKAAGLIRKAEVKEANIYTAPDLGTFDVIAADLPFGMVISRDEDLRKLYRAFLQYAECALKPGGRLAMYTSEYKILEGLLSESKFQILETLNIKSMTAVNAYLSTKILICTR